MLAERSIALKAAPLRKVLTLRGPDGGRPKLLLAEDSDPVRIVTAAMLKGMGCDVDAVVHGEDAVKSASTHPFDVIVLDIEMPVMDGITAARNIRKLGGTLTQTPIKQEHRVPIETEAGVFVDHVPKQQKLFGRKPRPRLARAAEAHRGLRLPALAGRGVWRMLPLPISSARLMAS